MAVVHEKFVGPMVTKNYLDKYRSDIATGKLVTRDNAKMALGTNVDGYVMPMFNSQTAIAYNPTLVPNPPKSYAELKDWPRRTPSSSAITASRAARPASASSWLDLCLRRWRRERSDERPLQGRRNQEVGCRIQEPCGFHHQCHADAWQCRHARSVVARRNRHGPVWVDMFYSWKADGRLPPDMKLILPAPGMPGQPMHYVIPEKAANKDLAEKFIALATSPKVQAEGIVKRFNWYPGIDADKRQAGTRQGYLEQALRRHLAGRPCHKGKPFPIAPYNNAILEAYEKSVK